MSGYELTKTEKQRRKEVSEHTRNMILSRLDIEEQDETSVMTGSRGYYLQISFSELHPLMVFCLARNLEHTGGTRQLNFINDLNLKILIPVVIGGVVGLLAFSHLLSWIFKNYRDITIAVLTGFILGSMPIIWPWKNDVITYFGSEAKVTGYDYYLPELNMEFAIALVILLIGAGIIVLTEKMAKNK